MSTGQNDQIIRDWIAELKSGKHSQIKYHLSSDKGFCCLGVLCYKVESYKNLGTIGSFLSSCQLSYSHLVSLNDKQGKSFEEIAGYIEDFYFGTNS